METGVFRRQYAILEVWYGFPADHSFYVSKNTWDKVTLCPEEIRKLTELSQVNVDGTKLIYKYGRIGSICFGNYWCLLFLVYEFKTDKDLGRFKLLKLQKI